MSYRDMLLEKEHKTRFSRFIWYFNTNRRASCSSVFCYSKEPSRIPGWLFIVVYLPKLIHHFVGQRFGVYAISIDQDPFDLVFF